MVSHFSNFAGGDALLCGYFSCINIARYQSTNQYNTKDVFCSVHARQVSSVTSGGFVLHYRKDKGKQTIVRKIIERANSEGISFGKNSLQIKYFLEFLPGYFFYLIPLLRVLAMKACYPSSTKTRFFL